MPKCHLLGFDLEMKYNGGTVVPGPDGYVGKFIPGLFTFDIRVRGGDRIIPFFVRGGEKTILAVPHDPVFYRVHKVPIIVTQRCVPPYPRNTVSFMHTDFHGKANIHELGIVRRAQSLYVIFHNHYDAQCYSDQGKVVCPYFRRWPAMQRWLEELYIKEIHSLPPIAQYYPIPTKPLELDDHEGIVKWYNPLIGQGEGYIRTYYHGSYIEAAVRGDQLLMPGVGILLPGAYVKYATLEHVRVSRYKRRWEARAVKLA